ncbi:MAG: AbrB/MazE/SpoVT family DNA-binding domain-containing protein [Acidimicrobiales bacterium]
MEVAARITAKGQVTIPAAVRRALDLDVGDEVIFEVDPAPSSPHAQVRKAADFMALAGSVPVPPEWADADWPSLRATAWSAQAERHHHPGR